MKETQISVIKVVNHSICYLTKIYNQLLSADSRAIKCYGLHQQIHGSKVEFVLSRVDVDNNFSMTSIKFFIIQGHHFITCSINLK